MPRFIPLQQWLNLSLGESLLISLITRYFQCDCSRQLVEHVIHSHDSIVLSWTYLNTRQLANTIFLFIPAKCEGVGLPSACQLALNLRLLRLAFSEITSGKRATLLSIARGELPRIYGVPFLLPFNTHLDDLNCKYNIQISIYSCRDTMN